MKKCSDQSWSVGEDVGNWAHQGADALNANVHFILTEQGLQTANADIVVSRRDGRVCSSQSSAERIEFVRFLHCLVYILYGTLLLCMRGG